jgi:hypothetical protein
MKHIEDELLPKKNKLQSSGKGKDKTFFVEILDAELDILHCDFQFDGCVTINTENYSYLALTVENLYALIALINESEIKYEKMFEKK